MLIVLFLGIADFARVFQAGIVTEAAARDAAEAVALERLREGPPTTPGDPVYYQRLHEIAERVACAEMRQLPNSTFDAATSTCPSMPVIATCVQDGNDPLCGDLAPGYSGTPPAQCSEISRAWVGGSGGPTASHSVEVRLCYQFTTIVNLNFSLPLGWGLSLGDIYLQKSRGFVVDCPPGDVSGC